MNDEQPIPCEDSGILELASNKDLRVWKRAIHEKWPITDEMREIITEEAFKVLINSNNARDKLNASRILVGIDDQNVKRADMVRRAVTSQRRQSASQPTVNVNVGVGVHVTDSLRAALDNDPEYLKFLEQRILEGDAVDVGETGGEVVPDAGPHSQAEHGSNGHHRGNGWHPSANGHDATETREE